MSDSAEDYDAQYDGAHLKLIVVMGFPHSGKTTSLGGRFDPPPQLIGLSQQLSGGADVPVGGNEHCREATCQINGKMVDVYFGLDGDSEEIIYQNIKNIGDKSPKPYDVAIITLQRRTVDTSLSVGTVWQKWIDRSIQKYTNENSPFPDHERYYVHTIIPQICTAANKYGGQIGTTVISPPNKTWDSLTTSLQDHIIDLLLKIV